tara:strand:- start:500 stop:679 length:180 start_codon:yes stop_codon:yes gene_type:complete
MANQGWKVYPRTSNFVLMEILLQMVLVGMRIIRVDVVKLKYDALQMVALYVMDFIQIVL